ncbi:MAG: tetratricopeptide repeat protein [Acidobacteria bacterium]|nr:tetratricopeptide repeat protein [Acidobacteriota bacterium]
MWRLLPSTSTTTGIGDRAEPELRRALALNPNSGEAHNLLGNLYSALGNHEAANSEMKRAQNLDPLSVPLIFDGMMALMNAGRYTEAAQLGATAVQKESRAGPLRSTLGLSQVLAGRTSDGLRELEAGFRLEATPMVALFLSLGHAVAGNRSEALQVLGQVKERAKRQYVCAFEVASVHAVLGEKDEAFRWFDKGNYGPLRLHGMAEK